MEKSKSNNGWFSQMGCIFNSLGLSYLSDTSNVSLRKQFSVKQRIIDIHIQEQNMRLRNSKKLNTLMKFYKSNSRPSYVDILKNKNERAMLSKMRVSAHKLAIESGRYTRIKTPKRERLCTVCNSGEIEDEEHFLLNCNAYTSIRHGFLTKLVNMNNQCLDLKIILDNNNYYILKQSAKFIDNCFKQRETVIS